MKIKENVYDHIQSIEKNGPDFSLIHLSGSGSTRLGTNSAPESTRPRVNSVGSTRPVYFPNGESGYHICT